MEPRRPAAWGIGGHSPRPYTRQAVSRREARAALGGWLFPPSRFGERRLVVCLALFLWGWLRMFVLLTLTALMGAEPSLSPAEVAAGEARHLKGIRQVTSG